MTNYFSEKEDSHLALRRHFPGLRAIDSRAYFHIPYLIRPLAELTFELSRGTLNDSALNTAWLRMDIALSSIWQEVEDLFEYPAFASRYEAAAELLTAAAYAVNPSKALLLAEELTAAMEQVESLAKTQLESKQGSLIAAEE